MAADRMPRSWSRRSLLVALAAGSVTALSVTALSGCRVQLEEGAPQIPLVPTRVPMKDELALLSVLGRTTSLESLARAVGGASTSLTGRMSAVHATQVGVIVHLLREGGVPESLIAASTTSPPTAATTASATTAPPTTAAPTAAPATTAPLTPTAVLSAAERDSVGDVALAGLSSTHVALIGSVLAQRTAAVTLLGGTTAPVAASGLDSAGLDSAGLDSVGLQGAEAVRLLAAARAAVYGFEVVAAQIGSGGLALAMSTLASLRTRASELEAMVATSAPPPPLGYALPFPVTDAKSARRLALHLLEGLLISQGAALEPATGDLATLVRWLGATEVVAFRWGAPLTAFPGLNS